MNRVENILIAEDGGGTEENIEKILSMMSDEEFESLKSTLKERFDLEYDEIESHPYNIKTIIKGKKITFSKNVSAVSRAFMILHSLGHYYFICEAKRKSIERYAYIYDLKGVQSALHYYETAEGDNALTNPPEMTEQRRKDRISFEIGANNFAVDLLEHIGLEKAERLVRKYELGDINYILDVTRGGKAAISQSDRIYLEKYVCGEFKINPDDAHDDGVYDAASFDINSIDWNYINDIKLEIHFF